MQILSNNWHTDAVMIEIFVSCCVENQSLCGIILPPTDHTKLFCSLKFPGVIQHVARADKSVEQWQQVLVLASLWQGKQKTEGTKNDYDLTGPNSFSPARLVLSDRNKNKCNFLIYQLESFSKSILSFSFEKSSHYLKYINKKYSKRPPVK